MPADSSRNLFVRMFANLLKFAFRLSKIAVFGYASLCFTAYALQEFLMFFPAKEAFATPPGGIGKIVAFPSKDGTKLSGWFVPGNGRGAILYFHGNGGNLRGSAQAMEDCRSLGLDCFTVDYRGYGASSGSLRSERDFYDDAESSFEYLVSRGYAPSRIAVWGYSLGGAAAVRVASRKPVGALIVESSFVSMNEMGRYQYPFLPVEPLNKYPFRSVDAIANVRAPTLVIHSPQDETIPFRQGLKLFEAAPGEKLFLTISGSHGGGHSDSRDHIRTAVSRILHAAGILPKSR